jgi:hypothetical protein
MTEQEILAFCKEHFEYREDGFLYWVEPPYRHPQLLGQRAGRPQSSGYWRVKICGRMYSVHRLVWLMHYEQWPADQVDHIDQNKTNNRLDNLREANFSQNQQNVPIRKSNKSGTTGVYFFKDGRKKPWRAHVKKDGKSIFCRYFATYEEAIAAREAAEREHFTHSPLNTK